jgi:hypothetical protein
MSTNCAVGVVIKGKIHAVYGHWDGYVDGVGKTLYNHYDQAKAEALIAQGSFSVLGSEIGVAHAFDADRGPDALKYKNMCTFYGRDRGEEDQEAVVFDTSEEFVDYFSGEYWYLLGTDGIWYVCAENSLNKWKPVCKVLGKQV